MTASIQERNILPKNKPAGIVSLYPYFHERTCVRLRVCVCDNVKLNSVCLGMFRVVVWDLSSASLSRVLRGQWGELQRQSVQDQIWNSLCDVVGSFKQVDEPHAFPTWVESDGWAVRGIGLWIRRLPVRFLAVQNDVVSLGKALHPTCLGGDVPVLTVSRSG